MAHVETPTPAELPAIVIDQRTREELETAQDLLLGAFDHLKALTALLRNCVAVLEMSPMDCYRLVEPIERQLEIVVDELSPALQRIFRPRECGEDDGAPLTDPMGVRTLKVKIDFPRGDEA